MFNGNSTTNVICSLQTIPINEIQDAGCTRMDFGRVFK